jgi:hypothetical protein
MPLYYEYVSVWLIVLNATFTNISAIAWRLSLTLHIITKHALIRRGHDRMMVGLTTTYAIGDYRH